MYYSMVKALLGRAFGLTLKKGFEPFYGIDYISHRNYQFTSGFLLSSSFSPGPKLLNGTLMGGRSNI